MIDPVLLPENVPLFDGMREGRLLVQECIKCAARQIGSALCRACGGDVSWIDASGRGAVEAATTVRLPPTPDMEAPYVLVLVRLDEGPRLMGRLDPHPGGGEATVGDIVRISFDDVRGAAVVPSFTPVVVSA